MSRKLASALAVSALLSTLGSGCEGRKAHLYTEANSHACLLTLASNGGSYKREFNLDAKKGASSLEFPRPSKASVLGVSFAFYPSEAAAKKLFRGPAAGGWHHPAPGLGVEFDRSSNVIEFWHQGIPDGPAPSAAQRKAVARCLS